MPAGLRRGPLSAGIASRLHQDRMANGREVRKLLPILFAGHGRRATTVGTLLIAVREHHEKQSRTVLKSWSLDMSSQDGMTKRRPPRI